jgi:hypothetical protein
MPEVIEMNRSDFDYIMDNHKHIKIILDSTYTIPNEGILYYASKMFGERDIRIIINEDSPVVW